MCQHFHQRQTACCCQFVGWHIETPAAGFAPTLRCRSRSSEKNKGPSDSSDTTGGARGHRSPCAVNLINCHASRCAQHRDKLRCQRDTKIDDHVEASNTKTGVSFPEICHVHCQEHSSCFHVDRPHEIFVWYFVWFYLWQTAA